MNRKTRKPAPDHETTSLYRFCLSHGLSLSPQERAAEGIALSKVARERELPLVKIRERIEDRWIRSRIYPVSFLDESSTKRNSRHVEAGKLEIPLVSADNPGT